MQGKQLQPFLSQHVNRGSSKSRQQHGERKLKLFSLHVRQRLLFYEVGNRNFPLLITLCYKLWSPTRISCSILCTIIPLGILRKAWRKLEPHSSQLIGNTFFASFSYSSVHFRHSAVNWHPFLSARYSSFTAKTIWELSKEPQRKIILRKKNKQTNIYYQIIKLRKTKKQIYIITASEKIYLMTSQTSKKGADSGKQQ